ncbi:FAD/FMN-containing dehydrogenase [Paenibacillus caui]|uniref:FAD/FMN-containing dehydrogenase n=1 Tax=Paenibacillus caui TaxID=2873927 RepID=UPI001CA969E3|nr:FAD/FMN-containing dehydrogenase [Paenibacillus caui]
MKKIWIGITASVLLMGIGTAGAYAASTGNNNGTSADNSKDFFEQMLPYGKQMHPNLTDEQIKKMHNICHDSNGTGMRQMMNHSQVARP